MCASSGVNEKRHVRDVTPIKRSQSQCLHADVSIKVNSSPLSLFVHTAPSYPSNSSLPNCSKSKTSSLFFLSFTCISFLLLAPFCGLVLFTGIQRQWRRASAAAKISNCDLLTYNIVALEPIGFLAYGSYCISIYTLNFELIKVAVCAVYLVYQGRLLFHCLTCVDQYVAVMHPIIYLNLKTERGVLAKNAIIAFVWLMSMLTFLFSYLFSYDFPLPFILFFAFGLTVITYCTLSVFHALIRPGPGDVPGNKRRVDQTKKRAYFTMLAIAGTLYVNYIGLLICVALHKALVLESDQRCMVFVTALWFSLPSSLTTPLLFLYRAGKLPLIGS